MWNSRKLRPRGICTHVFFLTGTIAAIRSAVFRLLTESRRLMKGTTMKKTLGWFFYSGLCFILSCANLIDNNPRSPTNNFGYYLSLSMDTHTNKLEVFKQYSMICSTGEKPYKSYQFIKESSEAFIITSIIRDTLKRKDTLRFFGIHPFNENAFIQATRQNDLLDTIPIKLNVVNPYHIKFINAFMIAGQPNFVNIAYNGDSADRDRSLIVTWSMKEEGGGAA
jgi:hypothetical protein